MNMNLYAFLWLIRNAEGTAGQNGYRTMFGGGLVYSFADHPRQLIRRKSGGKFISSTAAGAYQFLAKTWDECRLTLDLPDFSPASQDRAARFLIHRRDALDDVIAGKLFSAIKKCNKEWASLPGSPYGQPTISLDKALALFTQAGGLNTETKPNV